MLAKPQFVIEGALAPDYEAVSRLIVASYRDLLGDKLDAGYAKHLGDVATRAQVSQVYVAREAGRVVGTVTYVSDPSSPMAEGLLAGETEVRMLAVDPSFQGRGYGRLLAQHCIELAIADGAQALFLHSTQFMTKAHRLYESLGFVRIPTRDFQVNPEVLLLAFHLPLVGQDGNSKAQR